MSPELVKYLLIGVFVFMIAVVIYEWSKTGFKLAKTDPNKPLFRVPGRAERGKRTRTELGLAAAFIALMVALERCSV